MFLFFEWKGHKYPLLNVLCWGTGLQIIERLANVDAHGTHTPRNFAVLVFAIWCTCHCHRWSRTWILWRRVFTASDGNGDFGALHRHNSPWQNSRTEKAGGTFKEKLKMVLDEVSAMTRQDLDLCLKETCIARNRAFNRSGFSPYQRALGVNPRMPGSLLSDDILNPELLQLSASEEMQRSWKAREADQMAWIKQQDIDSVRRSVKAATRSSDLKPLSVGEWVFVWRSIPTFTGWSGPGVLLATSPNERSMWVPLRGHLLKVSREHLRPATAEEHFGAELIKELSAEMLEDIKDSKVRQFHDLTQEPVPGQEQELQISTEPFDEDMNGPQQLPPIRVSRKKQLQSSQRFQMTMGSAWLQPRQSLRPETWPLIRTKSLTTWSQKPKALEHHQCHLQRQLQVPHHQFQQVEDRALLLMKLLEVHFAPQERGKNREHQSEAVKMQAPECSHILLLAIHLLSRFRQDLQMAQHHSFWKLPTSMERKLDTTTGRMDQMAQFGGSEVRTQQHVTALQRWISNGRCGRLLQLCSLMRLHHQSEDVAGQVDFKSLNEKHRVVFQKAREKEVQPLIDNKAIRIMSVDESRAFRKKFPQNVLGSRYVDRWKPNGDTPHFQNPMARATTSRLWTRACMLSRGGVSSDGVTQWYIA